MHHHARIAAKLETIWSGEIETHAGELHCHCLRAEALVPYTKTAEYARLAGRAAARSGGTTDALEFFRKGLELIADGGAPELQARLNVDLARVTLRRICWVDLDAEAYDHFDAALRYYERIGDAEGVASIIQSHEIFYLISNYNADPHNLYERCLALTIKDLTAYTYALAVSAIARMKTVEGNKTGRRLLESVLEVAIANGDTTLEIPILRALASHNHAAGDYAECLRHNRRIIELFGKAPERNIETLVFAMHHERDQLWRLGRLSEAAQSVQRLVTYCESLNRPDLLMEAKMSQISHARDVEKSIDAARRIIEEVEEISVIVGWAPMALKSQKLALAFLAGWEDETRECLETMADDIENGVPNLIYSGIMTKYLLLTHDRRWMAP